MSKVASREMRLASRPTGIPTAANFTLAWTGLEAASRPAGARPQPLHVGGSHGGDGRNDDRQFNRMKPGLRHR